MSGPHPPGREPDIPDSANEPESELSSLDSADDELNSELNGALAPLEESVSSDETDAYSRAYSAPESEQFMSGTFVPADLALYDYDDYRNHDDEERSPRWPALVVGAAVVAAIALVTSVAILFAERASDSRRVATPGTSIISTTPVAPSTTPAQDEITTTTTTEPPPPPPPPPPTTSETPTTTETPTSTVTPPPPPPPPSSAPPAPASTTAAPPPPSPTAVAPPPPPTPAGPRQVTYSVTGTKAPGDIISVTYVDASGRRRTQHNVYIPWSMTVTPISTSDVGSVEASSLFRVSRLNCSIITSDGTVLSANTADSPQTSC